MLLTISQYAGLKDNVGFLLLKQDYLNIRVWKIAFYTHVFSAIIALMAGFTQFSNYVLKEHRKLHSVVGKIYAYNILLINFPAGLIMGIYANGHLPSKIAFLILDFLWFTFTFKAVAAIRKKDVKKHKQFMIRSYALTFSAITLRLWKIVFVILTPLDVTTIYMIDAWMGFVPNLLFAEWYIRSRWGKNGLASQLKINKKKKQTETA
jgi:uncharacterized membrane protein